MRRAHRAARLGPALALLLLAVAALADIPQRPVQVAFREGALAVSFSARELVNDAVRTALTSGLQKQFVLTAQVYPQGGSTPVATRVLSCRVVYDLWDEVFVVRRGRRPEPVPTLDAAIGRCLDVRQTVVADATRLASLRGRDAFLAVRAEFNPVAVDACARSLRRPGGDDPLGPVVINIVRREICRADRAVEFRSAPFRVP